MENTKEVACSEFGNILRQIQSAFIEGVLSQEVKEYHQQGMYSEDEVKDLIKKAIEFYSTYHYLPLGTWFNENKKK